jgi:DNA-nicking Smr family endonuclease
MSGKNKFASRNSFSDLNALLDEAGIRLKPTEEKHVPQHPPASPRSSDEQKPKNNCTDEDLFIQSMGGVQRASWRRGPHRSSKPVPASVVDDPDMEAKRLMQAAVAGTYPMEILDHPEYIEGWIGVDGKRFLPKLRNGFYSIQGQIDLHGLSREEAQKEVEEYIIRMSRFHSCCIKIIHGRGINSPTDRATLKEALQQLLSTRKMSRHVVAYASAQVHDGGVGAVYVLLSRQ